MQINIIDAINHSIQEKFGTGSILIATTTVYDEPSKGIVQKQEIIDEENLMVVIVGKTMFSKDEFSVLPQSMICIGHQSLYERKKMKQLLIDKFTKENISDIKAILNEIETQINQ